MATIDTDLLKKDKEILIKEISESINNFNKQYHPLFIQINHDITTIAGVNGRVIKSSHVEGFINLPQ